MVRVLRFGLVSLLLVVTACNVRKEGEAKLPPASGAGAAPMPDLPRIEGAQLGSAVAPTEGRTTGTTYPRQESQIGPTVSGLITEVAVAEGQPVKKGDVLFRQDARDAQLRVQQAKAALSAAEVGFRTAELSKKRADALLKEQAMNQAQYDQAQAAYDGAKVGVDQAKVALEMAEKFLADTVVRAPFAGVITSKQKNPGEMATTMPPTVVLIIQDQEVLELRFRLPERALATVKPGDSFVAHFAAINVDRPAKIVRVQPTIDTRTRTIELVAEIPNADHALRPGLLAEIRLSDAGPATAEAVPTEAAP